MTIQGYYWGVSSKDDSAKEKMSDGGLRLRGEDATKKGGIERGERKFHLASAVKKGGKTSATPSTWRGGKNSLSPIGWKEGRRLRSRKERYL